MYILTFNLADALAYVLEDFMRIAVVGATGMLGQHVARHTLRSSSVGLVPTNALTLTEPEVRPVRRTKAPVEHRGAPALQSLI